MLNVHNLSVSFLGSFLFEQVSFCLSPGDRVGLIGKNGAGKSTMLKLLSKELEPDSGVISLDKNTTIGFLKQDIDFIEGRTVLEEAYEAFDKIRAIEQELEKVNTALASRTDYESKAYQELMHAVGDLSDRYEILGGYNYKGTTEKILLGLGFSSEDFNKLTDTFSGGWRMRIELAKLLLQDNDVLLLDEPTNHLDIESIVWLEQFLRSYAGAVVVVSHDKMFLDNVTNRTIELVAGKIYDYNKPYSAYLIFREERIALQRNAQKNQEKQIQQTEKLIEKFRAKATKATMAQSLIKKLDKIERIEVDAQDTGVMAIRFPMAQQPGKVVVTLEGVCKSYGEKQILSNVDLLLERGSKIAFVGQNGQGKSTLAKIIVGALQGQGVVKLGHNVSLGYFAQNQAEQLNGNLSVLQTMEDAATDTNRAKVRDMLGAFLFQGDDVDKKVHVLSGGERNRLALCKMLLHPFNVLVMDEPTNHLDIKSKQVLKAALEAFEGTLILVSHDRDFLQGLTTSVYEFKDRNIKQHLGDINDYLTARSVTDFRAVEKKTIITTTKQDNTAKVSYQDQKKIKTLKNKLSKTEASIADLEKEITQLDADLALDYDKLMQQADFFEKYQAKKDTLEQLMILWEELSESLMALE